MLLSLSDRLPFRVALVVRAVVLLALGAPVLWARDVSGMFALVTLSVVWLLTTALEFRGRLPLGGVTLGEALLVAAICGVCAGTAPIILAAVSVPPFTASLYRGPVGVARVLSCEIVVLVTTAYLVQSEFTAEQVYSGFSCLVLGLGLGLVGCFIYGALQERRSALTPYHYAQGLLRQLIDIADGLESGLNPVTLGGQLLWDAREKLPGSAIALYVPRGDGLTPLVAKSLADGDLDALEGLARRAFALQRAIRQAPGVAIPLEAGSGITAILAVQLPSRLEAGSLASDERIAALVEDLRPAVVHLDTALLFGTFREHASAEERRRLAREMHDGVAQDIASLGYLVDAIAGDAAVPRQQERIVVLRERISAIVAEVRRSLVNLRTDIGESESLGAAIATLARSLSNASGVAINVSADETTERLRPEVEAELFRIVQESISNALKHAQATEVDVHCQVRAPSATITVTDDGRGMGTTREDSHGLEIMRERAALVDAVLEIGEAPSGGVRVSVTIQEDNVQSRPAEVTVIGAPFDSETRVEA
ncbi:MAG: sensor histidine kinase [Nocardioides sp.]|uniref:sensor histidine kinase n=1 Tax=Nocardioides sp. TaxID=35761 RepID=UPI0039E4E0A6